MITVVDYGAGNLQSVRNALEKLGVAHRISGDAGALAEASQLMLPGVGHFGQMMRSLRQLGLRQPLCERITAGVPFLGICLGLQALFEGSEEAADEDGLGLLRGSVRRFGEGERVPQMGWNRLEQTRPCRLLEGLEQRPFMYFANSYYAPAGEETAATCTYGVTFTAIIESGNISAVQFHPEKSGAAGLRMIANFAGLSC